MIMKWLIRSFIFVLVIAVTAAATYLFFNREIAQAICVVPNEKTFALPAEVVAQKAAVVVVEFTDFQCPYCRRNQKTMEKLRKTYGDKVAYVFKPFPLKKHPQAVLLSRALFAARLQGRGEAMRARLFALPDHAPEDVSNHDSLYTEYIQDEAGQLGLDLDQFMADLQADSTERLVQASIAEGETAGVISTPTVFINGARVKGAKEFVWFKKIIDKFLAQNVSYTHN